MESCVITSSQRKAHTVILEFALQPASAQQIPNICWSLALVRFEDQWKVDWKRLVSKRGCGRGGDENKQE
jgi:hypothetical protein